MSYVLKMMYYRKAYKKLRSNSWHLGCIAQKDRSYFICNVAVKNKHSNLAYVPDKLMDLDILEPAAMKNTKYITCIDTDKLTQEFCDSTAEVSENMELIHYPPKFRSDTVFWYVLIKNIKCYPDVPKRLLNKENTWRYLKSISLSSLGHVPAEILDLDMCRFAVKKYGENINHVPPKFLDVEMYRLALNTMSDISQIPPRAIDNSVRKEFVKNHDKSFFYGWTLRSFRLNEIEWNEAISFINYMIHNTTYIITINDMISFDDAERFTIYTQIVDSAFPEKIGVLAEIVPPIVWEYMIEKGMFSMIPKDKQNVDMCIDAIRRNEYDTHFVRKDLWNNTSLCIELMTINPSLFLEFGISDDMACSMLVENLLHRYVKTLSPLVFDAYTSTQNLSITI